MNVVVIVLDTLRPDALGSSGNPVCRTPTLDQLAAQGTTFTQAYAEFPLTVPFRVSALTSTFTFPCRPWAGLRAEERSVVEAFAEAGYRTAAFTDTPMRSGLGLARGFTEFTELPGKLASADPRPPGEQPGPASGAWREADLGPCGERDRERWRNFSTGYLGEQRQRHGKVGIDLLVDRATDWLDGAARSTEPFLLWVDSFEAHEPWLAPREWVERYQPPGYRGRFLPLPHGPESGWLDEGEIDHVRRLYWSEVSYADHHVGRLLAHLDHLGRAEDTLVVVLSDHGVSLGEHGQIRKAGIPLYDEHARILWTMRAPGLVPAGKRIDSPVQTPDVAATLLDAAGLKLAAAVLWGTDPGAPEPVQGRSVLPLARGEVPWTRQNAYLGAFGLRSAVRSGPWKFIDHRGERPAELFHLESDPAELHDRAAAEPELAAMLHRRLWRFQSRWARAYRA